MLPRDRLHVLLIDQLVTVGVDAVENERTRVSIYDPLRIWTHRKISTGELTGAVFHSSSAEFVVTLAADPAIVWLRFYATTSKRELVTLALPGEVPVQRGGDNAPLRHGLSE